MNDLRSKSEPVCTVCWYCISCFLDRELGVGEPLRENEGAGAQGLGFGWYCFKEFGVFPIGAWRGAISLTVTAMPRVRNTREVSKRCLMTLEDQFKINLAQEASREVLDLPLQLEVLNFLSSSLKYLEVKC